MSRPANKGNVLSSPSRSRGLPTTGLGARRTTRAMNKAPGTMAIPPTNRTPKAGITPRRSHASPEINQTMPETKTPGAPPALAMRIAFCATCSSIRLPRLAPGHPAHTTYVPNPTFANRKRMIAWGRLPSPRSELHAKRCHCKRHDNEVGDHNGPAANCYSVSCPENCPCSSKGDRCQRQIARLARLQGARCLRQECTARRDRRYVAQYIDRLHRPTSMLR